MSIGENIKRLRRDKGLTQGELASLSKLGLNMISKLEGDKTDPKLTSLYKLIGALECTADALLIDSKISSLPTILKTQFERVNQLPEENQKAIIHVMENYCNAIAYGNMVEGRGFFSMQPIMGKTEKVLK